MKKTFFVLGLLLATGAVSISCDRDDDEIVVSASELPENAKTFLQLHFADVAISRVERDTADNDYDVYLANGYKIEFDTNGAWKDINGNGKTLPASVLALLPSGIENYRAANYTSTSIVEVEKTYLNGTHTGYKVDLSNGVELTFNTNGNINSAQPTTVTLPQNASTFLQTHFTNISVSRVEKNSSTNSYEVYLANGFKVNFDANGEWKDVNGNNNTLPASVIALLPSNIETYRSSNHPSASIIEVKKTLNNNVTTGYNVDLSNGVDLIFEANGNIPAPTSVLPQTANTFLQTHFSNVNILRVERDSNDNDYDVYLANGYEVEFDYNGTWRDINGNNKALPTSVLALLPSKIESYRATNYPSTNITEVEKVYTNGTLSGYSIELSNGIDLVFDANGNLSNSNPSTPSTPQASLPQEANTFLQTHFAGVNISRIERDSDDNDYEVYLANGYELEFNSTGIWKDVNGGTNRPLPASVLALLPSGIENYRATNYPSTTIIEVEKNFTNGTLTGYNVDLSNGVDLIFNADGNFVRFDD